MDGQPALPPPRDEEEIIRRGVEQYFDDRPLLLRHNREQRAEAYRTVRDLYDNGVLFYTVPGYSKYARPLVTASQTTLGDAPRATAVTTRAGRWTSTTGRAALYVAVAVVNVSVLVTVGPIPGIVVFFVVTLPVVFGGSPSPDKPTASPGVRAAIPQAIKREVWRRDQGACTACGSRERLEYDHIIPVSRGGANTVRNIELLCEQCNRRKGATI